MIQILQLDDPRWDDALASFRYDFYHLRGYVKLNLSSADKGIAIHYQRDGLQLFLPVILSPFETERYGKVWDAKSPYGYSSPLALLSASPEANRAFLEEALSASLAYLKNQQVISLFIRVHPLLPPPVEFMKDHGHLLFHGRTVSVDLTLPLEEIWRLTDANDRRRINKLKALGCVAQVDPLWQSLDEFHGAYSGTMERLGAASFYRFSKDYFLQLRSLAPDNFHLVVVKDNAGTVMWGGIFSEFNGLVQFHLSGTMPLFEKLSPTKLALDFVRSWAKARGNSVFHLGGGFGAKEDPLFESKRRLGTQLHPFYTWRMVVAPKVFESLTTAAGLPASADDFFPPYRAKPS